MLAQLGIIARLFPIMATAGQLEKSSNFSYFNSVFTFPLKSFFHNHFYSYNSANIHFIAIDLAYFDDNPNEKALILH